MRPIDFLAGNPVLLPGMGKPRIIVLSDDDADEFRWLSDGWFDFNPLRLRRGLKYLIKVL